MSPSVLVQYVRFLHDQLSANQALAGFLNSFRKPLAPAVRGQVATNPPRTTTAVAITQTGAIQAFDSLRQLMSPLFNATAEEKEVLVGFGVMEYSTEVAYERMKDRARESQVQAEAEWSRVSGDLKNFLIKLNALFAGLNQFAFGAIDIPDGTAELEVIFDQDASIDDVVGAKEWFSKWYHIVDGYARFLGKSKEDFIFVSLNKASPTKLRIRAALTDVGIIMTILGVLLQIQERFIHKEVVIEQLKATPLVSPEEDAQHIRKAEEALHAEEEKEVKRAAEDQLKLRNISDSEVQVFFTKGVENQYNFIVSGGTVNVLLPNSATPDQVKALDAYNSEKRSVRETQRRLQIVSGKAQKSIPDTVSSAPEDSQNN
jgi:hypothetical protein